MTNRFPDLAGKRIVHAATSANMLSAFGRVMATRMVEEQVDLHFLASSEPIYNRPADLVELSEMGGKPITIPLENSLHPFNLLRNIYRLWQKFRQIKPDIVHTRGAVMGIVGRIAARLSRVPVLVHHQDDLHSREERLSPLKRRISGHVEAWLARRSDHTFVVSDAVALAAKELGFPGSRLTNVGHDLNQSLVSFSRTAPAPHRSLQMLQRLGIDETHFLVGAVTRLEAHKGIDTLIDAAGMVKAKAPHTRFLVRGRGPEKARLMAQIDRIGLSEIFHIIEDWLTDADLVALYRSFDVFALPTRREGFGMAFAEAMLLGVVPIAPNIPPVNEVVSDKTGLLVPPTSQGFADAVLWAMENRQAMVKLRDTATRDALVRWGGSKAADKVLATYCDLLAQKGRG